MVQQQGGGGISLNPDDAEAGGSLPDGDYLFTNVRFELFNYPQRREGPLPDGARACTLTADLVDAFGRVYKDQRWGCGSEADFGLSSDGKMIMAKGTRQGLNTSSAGFAFFQGLVNANFPKDRIRSDCSVLENLYAHMQGVRRELDIDGRKLTQNYLVPAQVRLLPEQPGQRPTPTGAGAPGAVASAAPGAAAPVAAAPGGVTAAPSAPAAPAAPAPPAPPVNPNPAPAATSGAPSPVAGVDEAVDQMAKDFIKNLKDAGSLPATKAELTTAAFQAFSPAEYVNWRTPVAQLMDNTPWLEQSGLVTVNGQNIQGT